MTSYPPMRQKGLHRRFNDLAKSGNLETVGDFAGRFGTLGFERWLRGPLPIEQFVDGRAVAELRGGFVPDGG